MATKPGCSGTVGHQSWIVFSLKDYIRGSSQCMQTRVANQNGCREGHQGLAAGLWLEPVSTKTQIYAFEIFKTCFHKMKSGHFMILLCSPTAVAFSYSFLHVKGVAK